MTRFRFSPPTAGRGLPFALLLVALLASPLPMTAQLVLGQYEDEAPLRTWNILGPVGAASLGLGEARFALPADMTAALANPALLARLGTFTVTLVGSLYTAELYRFSVLNTGVLESRGNARKEAYALDYGGASFRWRGWTVGISAGLLADYGRPDIDYEYYSRGALMYSLSSDQSGFLRTFQVAVARDLGPRLALGLGFNLSDGQLARNVAEENVGAGYSILDDKTQERRGFFLNAGVAWEPVAGVQLGAAVRTPHTLKASDRSLLQYAAPKTGTLIEIRAEAEDTYEEPWVAGAGLAWTIRRRLLATADIAYFAWSKYRVVYFDEPLRRDFRDVVRLGAGVQYSLSISLLGRQALVPLRAGFGYDPQPMRESHSAYSLLTLGTGLVVDSIQLDFGILFGSERGSGRDLAVRRIALTMSYARTRETR